VGVSTNLGTKVNRRKRAIRLDPNVMEDISTEGSDKGDRIGIKVRDAWKESEEVTFNEFFLWDPKLFATVVDNCVLVRMMVNGVGASGGVEKVGEEVGYRLFI